MSPSHIIYSDIMVKQRIEAWAEGLDYDPEEQIFMLLEDKYGAKEVSVIDAHPEGDAMILIVGTDVWIDTREFALLKNGSLAW